MDTHERKILLGNVKTGGETDDCRLLRVAGVNLPAWLGNPISEGERTWAGRVDLEVGDWIVRIDRLEDEGAVPARYQITHILQITRKDGATIRWNRAEPFLQALFLWLSLFNGARCAPIVADGELSDGRLLWSRYLRWAVDEKVRWGRGALSGEFPIAVFEGAWPALSSSLQKLVELLSDQALQEAYRKAIHWYVTANTGKTDGDLMLAQAGLELLSYARLVLPNILSADALDRLPAADQISLLLNELGVDNVVPDEYGDLLAVVTDQAKRASAAVTEQRNRVVHPPRPVAPSDAEKRARALFQARALAIELLERCLLRAIDYSGPYKEPFRTG